MAVSADCQGPGLKKGRVEMHRWSEPGGRESDACSEIYKRFDWLKSRTSWKFNFRVGQERKNVGKFL